MKLLEQLLEGEHDGEHADETYVQDGLADLLYENAFEDVGGVTDIRTFEGAGIMTLNKGLVIQLGDGSVFQLTIVKA